MLAFLARLPGPRHLMVMPQKMRWEGWCPQFRVSEPFRDREGRMTKSLVRYSELSLIWDRDELLPRLVTLSTSITIVKTHIKKDNQCVYYSNIVSHLNTSLVTDLYIHSNLFSLLQINMKFLSTILSFAAVASAIDVWFGNSLLVLASWLQVNPYLSFPTDILP